MSNYNEFALNGLIQARNEGLFALNFGIAHLFVGRKAANFLIV